MIKNKTIGYLFLFVGLGNLVMMIDTLLTKNSQVFTFMSIPSNKEINITIYGIIGAFLIITGLSQINGLTNKKKH